MARMNYDCGLEAQALSYARQCPYMKSSNASAGENFSRFPASGLNTWADVVNKTVTSWWSVVNMNSIGVGVNAVTFRMFHVGTGIELWSQVDGLGKNE
ncbi:hypothetical protein OESDEN_10331 [Oesophagostomum dentatum]|uniref:SCP domain-containing protein n=1 Tax=Oesophagostomum dentatum TaxID=61180 RepID=A0A0B1T112_OESDE|nr:hypothetical protein OESDEN_10331 [Oesophagostomum dentatum]